MELQPTWRAIVRTPTPLAWFLLILGLLILLLVPVIAPATDAVCGAYQREGGTVGTARWARGAAPPTVHQGAFD
jgi:hypothetical protein